MSHMRLRRSWVFVSLVAVISACSAQSPETAEPTDAGTAAENATRAELLPTTVDALPEFDLATYEELLGQVKGTPLVVNIWASWCGPCNEEAPHLAAAHTEYGERVQFLGVDILDARQGAREFLTRYGWAYPSVFDPAGAIRDGLGLLGQPVTLVYAADGTLLSTYTGAIAADELDARIREALAA